MDPKWVADKLGMSVRHYSRLEAGDAVVTYSHIEELSKLLGISPIDLLSFDERVFFDHCEQAHAFGSNNTYNGSSLKERELYDARIKHLEEEVVFLRAQLEKAIGT